MALVIGAISYFRLLDNYEYILLDLRFKSRPMQKIDPQIVIIEIGNDTLANLGQWPLPRDYHASLIKVLSECQVKAVVFDILFSEPTEKDALLIEATRQAGCVYYPYALGLEEKDKGVPQAEEIEAPILPQLSAAAKGIGHANIFSDSDGKRRRIPLFISYQGRLMPQLSLRAAQDFLHIQDEDVKIAPGKFVQLGKALRISIDEELSTLVSIAGKWTDTFKHYSYCDILFAYANRKPDEEFSGELAQLKDKICFVGLTATGTSDINPNALESRYPMIGMHANLFNSMITKNFLQRASRSVNLVLLYFLCLLNIALVLKTKPPFNILYRLALLTLFVALGFGLFIFAGIWIDLFFPILIFILVYLGINIVRYIRELRHRELLEKELAIARNIQRSFLREVPAGLKDADISVAMDTAHHVGGDLYDIVQFPDGRIGLMVGDVSGKGVPAALFMAQVISQFRNIAGSSFSPASVLKELNQKICQQAKAGLFVTVAYLIYEPGKRKAYFASAGHLAPLIFRNSQLLEKIEVSEGIPIGLMPEAEFSEQQFTLTSQDLLLLYTDGVTEARDKHQREFSEQGLVQAVIAKPGRSSPEVIRALQAAIKAFVGHCPQHDDITMMVLRVI